MISATENQTNDVQTTYSQLTNSIASNAETTDTHNNDNNIGSSTKTYTDLFNGLINNKEYNLTDDYVFDKSKDELFEKGIPVITTSLTLNGNNHVIDAKGSTLFYMISSNVSINNLTLKMPIVLHWM